MSASGSGQAALVSAGDMQVRDAGRADHADEDLGVPVTKVWVNGSRGTQHTIDEARKRGIPVRVYA